MTLLIGADSRSPQPDLYRGHSIWAVYIAGDTFHLWTHAEVAALAEGGVRGVLPIVVPPQKENWWAENDGYGTLEALVRDAVAWGLPAGSPLVLDVEEGQAVHIGSNTCHAWAIACGVHHYIPWFYSSGGLLARDHWCHHWLAKWYGLAGYDHAAPTELPPHTLGWQYAGDVEGGRIDRDIFAPGHTYLTPQLKVETIMTVNPGEAAFGQPVPEDKVPAQQEPESVAAAEAPSTEPAPTEPEVAPQAEPVAEPVHEPSATEVKALADLAAAKEKLRAVEEKFHDEIARFFA
jgi:hypothetical protein